MAATPNNGPTDLSQKPHVYVPPGEIPPSKLMTDDIVEGDGSSAGSGDTVDVHYVGVSWKTRQQFDSSWDRQEPFSFRIGAGTVISGWEEGVEGMKVGGRRRMVLPPDKAYGKQGAGGVIGPNETLVFVVDLLAVQ